MKKGLFVFFLVLLSWLPATVAAQAPQKARSQEVSETDGVPVLVKHLPDWDKGVMQSTFTDDLGELTDALGDKPVLHSFDFIPGTEAVTAAYPEGKLLIVEFMTPQASVDADGRIKQWLVDNPSSNIVYRRIGNYNAFVFDAADQDAANALLGQVKYQKHVQWLGEDPFLLQKLERDFAIKTGDIFLSTLEIIGIGILLSIVGGLGVGYLYFQFREKQRKQFNEFSDAGGMVRLNLDGLSAEISPSRLLKE
jgi:hypothetical protein